MGLSAVMLALKSLEESIEIPEALADSLGLRTNRSDRKAKGSYLVSPKAAKTVEPPCFLNWPDTFEDADGIGQENVECNYTIEVDFFAPNTDKGPEMVLAFWDATWNALQAEKLAANRLGGTVDYLVLRAGSLMSLHEWNGLGYPGFQLFIDIQLFEAVT